MLGSMGINTMFADRPGTTWGISTSASESDLAARVAAHYGLDRTTAKRVVSGEITAIQAMQRIGVDPVMASPLVLGLPNGNQWTFPTGGAATNVAPFKSYSKAWNANQMVRADIPADPTIETNVPQTQAIESSAGQTPWASQIPANWSMLLPPDSAYTRPDSMLLEHDSGDAHMTTPSGESTLLTTDAPAPAEPKSLLKKMMIPVAAIGALAIALKLRS